MNLNFKIDYSILGNQINKLRKAKNWSQAKLAEKADLEPAYISHIERGVAKVSLPTIISIANALDATLDEIVYTNLNKSISVSNKIINELLEDCTPNEVAGIIEVLKATKKVLKSKLENQ